VSRCGAVVGSDLSCRRRHPDTPWIDTTSQDKITAPKLESALKEVVGSMQIIMDLAIVKCGD
jgi:hypothetical protein